MAGEREVDYCERRALEERNPFGVDCAPGMVIPAKGMPLGFARVRSPGVFLLGDVRVTGQSANVR
jgi:hypothetical protein